MPWVEPQALAAAIGSVSAAETSLCCCCGLQRWEEKHNRRSSTSSTCGNKAERAGASPMHWQFAKRLRAASHLH